MKTGLGSHGYTVVEALIFMAVTSAFFVLIATSISGQQAKTEFNQSVRDFETRLLDIANDISTGYYNLSSGVECTSTPGGGVDLGPVAAPPAPAKGTSENCIVVGQLIRFTADSGQYNIVPVVGKRRHDGAGYPKEVSSLAEATPAAIIPGSNPPYSTIPNASEAGELGNGLVFKSARFSSGGANFGLRGVLFASTFKAYSGSANDLESGSIQADVYPLPSTIFNLGSIASTADSIRTYTGWGALAKNPQDGIVLCFQPGANAARSAEITIGGSGRSLSTKTDIKNVVCPTPLP